MEVKSIFKTSGAPTAGSMAKSVALHVFVLVLLMLIPAQLLLRSEPPNKELDIVFYRPPEIAVTARAVSRPMPPGTSEGGSPPGAPAPALKPRPKAPAGPDLPGKAELPPGPEVGRAVSSIAPITGADRPKARSGPGPARTDEEIQIVFDRYKASFYRLYNRELRNNPALKGQMVLRLTIEPDGSVSMCALQSTDMDAPDLATQVVGRVRTINFGAKDGVPPVTIVYPIDFLPAA